MESTFFSFGNRVKGSSFKTSSSVEEVFLTIDTDEKASFTDELHSLYTTYLNTVEQYGLSEETLVFSRFYIADIANQKAALRESKILGILKKQRGVDYPAVSGIRW